MTRSTEESKVAKSTGCTMDRCEQMVRECNKIMLCSMKGGRMRRIATQDDVESRHWCDVGQG